LSRIDDEANAVVQPMVEAAAGLVAELEPQPEAAVGERRLRDVEAEHPVAGLLAPAERGRVLRVGGEQQAGLVTDLERDSGRGKRLADGDPQLDRRRLAGEQLLALLSPGSEEPRLDDPRLAASVPGQPGGALLR